MAPKTENDSRRAAAKKVVSAAKLTTSAHKNRAKDVVADATKTNVKDDPGEGVVYNNGALDHKATQKLHEAMSEPGVDESGQLAEDNAALKAAGYADDDLDGKSLEELEKIAFGS